jgi:dual specificity phosphatase 12
MFEITKEYNYYLYYWYGRFRGYLQSWLPGRKNFHEIAPNLFVGDLPSAYNKTELKEAGITHIINSVVGVPAPYPDDFKYLSVELRDQPYENIESHFDETNKFIDHAINVEHGKVFIHCLCGISRSSSIAAAYLIYKQNMSPEEAIEYMKKTREIINKNSHNHVYSN